MRKVCTTIGLAIALCFLDVGSFALADTNVELNAQVRPRGELIGAARNPMMEGAEHDVSVTQRSRLKLMVRHDGTLVVVSGQDIRTWGDAPQLNMNDANFSIHEAFVRIPLSE